MEEQVSSCTFFFLLLFLDHVGPSGGAEPHGGWIIWVLDTEHHGWCLGQLCAEVSLDLDILHSALCLLLLSSLSTRRPILCHPSLTNREANPKSTWVPCYHIHLMKQTDNSPKWKASPGGGLQPAKAHLTFSLLFVPVFDLAVCAHFQNVKELN